MGGVRRAPADAEDEKPPAPRAHIHEDLDRFLQNVRVEFSHDLGCLAEVLLCVAHGRRVLFFQTDCQQGFQFQQAPWRADFVKSLEHLEAGKPVRGG